MSVGATSVAPGVSASSIAELSTGGVSDDATRSAPPLQPVMVIPLTNSASSPKRSGPEYRDDAWLPVAHAFRGAPSFSLLRIWCPSRSARRAFAVEHRPRAAMDVAPSSAGSSLRGPHPQRFVLWVTKAGSNRAEALVGTEACVYRSRRPRPPDRNGPAQANGRT